MFTGNVGFLGGGLYCTPPGYVYAAVTLSSNVFLDNYASDGGGCYCTTYYNYNVGESVAMYNNVFNGNTASDVSNSGGSGAGGGAFCSSPVITLEGNAFNGNSAAGFSDYGYVSGAGGGAYCDTSAYANTTTMLVIGSNTFQNNSGWVGGGFYANGPTIALLDNLVVNNEATTNFSFGGGIWVDASSNLFMVNNTVSGNSSAGDGGGVAFEVAGTVEVLNVYNNIIWGNLATVNGGDVWLSGTGQEKVFSYNDVDSMYGVWDIAQNNIDVSPQFFDPVNGDFHTKAGSLCIAAGTTNAPSLPATDLDGNLRVINGLVDLGCYEFTTTVPHPADTNGDFVISPLEFSAYAAAWKSLQTWTNGPNPGPNPIQANYVTRAGYLMTNGGAYFNDGSARPVNWKIKQ
jgi:hypothetical protein